MRSIRSRIFYKMLQYSGSIYHGSAPLAQQRASIERMSKYWLMPPRVSITPISVGDMYAEWVKPHEHSNDRAILYLHGGGYTMGSCHTHHAMVAWISVASRAPALLVNYRLAPENPFPAALEDVIEAYRWLLSEVSQARRIVIAGDSAGGGLAIAASICLRDAKEQLPGGLVCISPWVDLTLSGDTILTRSKLDPLLSRETSLLHARWYVGQHDPHSPLISPIFADLSHLPPLIIQVGDYEILLSDAARLAEKARLAGVEVTLEIWEGMWHVWHLLAGFMPESRQAIENIGQFINQQMNF